MGDKATLAKARQELENLYLGIPDESVNLSFDDFISVARQQNGVAERRKMPMETISEDEAMDSRKGSSALGKLPNGEHLHPSRNRIRGRGTYENSRGFDDISVASTGVSISRDEQRVRRKRPGIPHSKFCTICTKYIYFLLHRCLVCGRAYCGHCVSVGMGELSEGRKCIDCLGRRFSMRYIHKAGSMGWCMSYPSRAKEQELRWAEKGPRRSGERRYESSTNMSRTRRPTQIPRSTINGGLPSTTTMSGIQLS